MKKTFVFQLCVENCWLIRTAIPIPGEIIPPAFGYSQRIANVPMENGKYRLHCSLKAQFGKSLAAIGHQLAKTFSTVYDPQLGKYSYHFMSIPGFTIFPHISGRVDFSDTFHVHPVAGPESILPFYGIMPNGFYLQALSIQCRQGIIRKHFLSPHFIPCD